MARRRNTQRGFTLAEILVALAIFALIFVAALAMYDQSNRVFKRGVEAGDTQQNVRVSFDKLVADVRMLGFDFDRDGIPTGSTSAVWAPNRTYGVGNLVTPTAANGFVYRMTPVAGGPTNCTSGAGEPVPWPTAVGAFQNDNSCRWQALQGLNQFQQPDEQIEFAHPSAITIRANYDFELNMPGDTENGREPNLESPEFPVVTTGNDEIVTYALRSDNGPNPDTIGFFADVVGRKAFVGAGGRPENQIRIPRVNLGVTTGTFAGRDCTADDPCFPDAPYTLYRFTLDDNGAPIETPLASNIRSLSFKYYNNTSGVPPAAPPTGWASVTRVSDPGGGQFNPATPAAPQPARNARAVIESVRVTVIGMSEAQEPNYTNPLESAGPLKAYHTYRLESLIVPRNIGRQGMREIPPNPPGAPILSSVTFGYCGAVKVDWLAPIASAGEGQVESYVIEYNTTGSTTVFPFLKDAGPNTSGTVTNLDPNLQYTFTVAAVNSYGNQTALVPGTTNNAVITVRPQNRTTPGLPASLGTGSGGLAAGSPAAQPNKITVSFPSPLTAASGTLQRQTPTGGPSAVGGVADQLYGEIVRYKVYRYEDTGGAVPTDISSPLYVDISSEPKNSLQISSGNVTYVDKTAQNCVRYYYKFVPVEYCGEPACGGGCNISPASGTGGQYPASGQPGIDAISTATANPAAPIKLTVLESPASPASQCTGARCDIYLQWDRVDTDIEAPPNKIVVAHYEVTRTRLLNGVIDADKSAPEGPAVQTFIADDPTPTLTTDFIWADNNIPAKDAGSNDYVYVYEVRALQCPDTATPPTYRKSTPSPQAKYPCPFNTTAPIVGVTLTMDGDGISPATAWLTNNPASQVAVTVSDPTKIASMQALLDDGNGGIIDLGTVTAPPYNFALVNTQVGQIYQLLVIARDTGGCTKTIQRWVEEATATGCCLAAFANDVSVVRYTPGTNFVDVALKNLCGQQLTIQTLSSPSPVPGLQFTWDPAIAGNTTATMLTTIEFPSTATGSATFTLNDPAPIGATAPRPRLINPPTATTPPALLNVSPGSNTYVIRFNFDKVLTNTTAPITKVCIVYRRTIDSTNQFCQIVPQPPSFNTCN